MSFFLIFRVFFVNMNHFSHPRIPKIFHPHIYRIIQSNKPQINYIYNQAIIPPFHRVFSRQTSTNNVFITKTFHHTQFYLQSNVRAWDYKYIFPACYSQNSSNWSANRNVCLHFTTPNDLFSSTLEWQQNTSKINCRTENYINYYIMAILSVYYFLNTRVEVKFYSI